MKKNNIVGKIICYETTGQTISVHTTRWFCCLMKAIFHSVNTFTVDSFQRGPDGLSAGHRTNDYHRSFPPLHNILRIWKGTVKQVGQQKNNRNTRKIRKNLIEPFISESQKNFGLFYSLRKAHRKLILQSNENKRK